MTATPTVVLKQDGEQADRRLRQRAVRQVPARPGRSRAPTSTFSFAMNVEGNALNVTYTGTVDKDGAIKGSVTYGDMMSGTFVAARRSSRSAVVQ